MNKKNFAFATVFFLLVLFAYFFAQNARYYMQAAGPGLAYKIDRKTGRVWLLRPAGQMEIHETQKSKLPSQPKLKWADIAKSKSYTDAFPEGHLKVKKAFSIELAKNSRVLDEQTETEQKIRYDLERTKGIIDKIIGWHAEAIDDQTYLVSFAYESEGEKLGYFFEANLSHNIVRLVAGDPSLEKKYKLRCFEKEFSIICQKSE